MTWTPVQSQFGPNVICASATDSSFLVTFNCYTVLAGYTAPSPIRNTGTPTVLLHSNSFITEWSVEFDQLILKADKSSFIHFYDKNGAQIHSVDAFISPSVRILNKTLTFETNFAFNVGSYYILFDYGAYTGTPFFWV
jgi:hypothetical protein